MCSARPLSAPPIYRVIVRGGIDARWGDWFSGLTLTTSEDQAGLCTMLCGAVPDQAALRGILNKLWDLNATLLSVEMVPALPGDEACHEH